MAPSGFRRSAEPGVCLPKLRCAVRGLVLRSGDMLKRRPDNRMSFKTPLTGYRIMLLAILCFLIVLWALVIIVRVVVG